MAWKPSGLTFARRRVATSGGLLADWPAYSCASRIRPLTKPRVFIGSSSEGLDVADALEVHLSASCEVRLWKNAFAPSDTFIESLEEALKEAEFAVLVVTADDLRSKRGDTAKVPRDNVVFELGLFMGHLGRERVFIATMSEHAPELPTDLGNLNVVTFDAERSDGDMRAAVSP